MDTTFGESKIMQKLNEIKKVLDTIQFGDQDIPEIEKQSKDHLSFLDQIYSFKDLNDLIDDFSDTNLSNQDRYKKILERLNTVLDQLKIKYDRIEEENTILKLNKIEIKTTTEDIDFDYVKNLFIAANTNIKSISDAVRENTIGNFNQNLQKSIKNLTEVTTKLREKTIQAKKILEKIPKESLVSKIKLSENFYFFKCPDHSEKMKLEDFNKTKFTEESTKIVEEKVKIIEQINKVKDELKRAGVDIDSGIDLRTELSLIDRDSRVGKLETLKSLVKQRDSIFGDLKLEKKEKKFINDNSPIKVIGYKAIKRFANLLKLDDEFLKEVNSYIKYCQDEKKCDDSCIELTQEDLNGAFIEKKMIEKFLPNEFKKKEKESGKVITTIKQEFSQDEAFNFFNSKEDDDIEKTLSRIISKFKLELTTGIKDKVVRVTVSNEDCNKDIVDILCKSKGKGAKRLLLAKYLCACITSLIKLFSGRKKSEDLIKNLAEEIDPNIKNTETITFDNLYERFPDVKQLIVRKDLIKTYLELEHNLAQFGDFSFKSLEAIQEEKVSEILAFINATLKNYETYFSDICGVLSDIKSIKYGSFNNMGVSQSGGGVEVEEYVKQLKSHNQSIVEYNSKTKEFLKEVEDFKTTLYQLYYYGSKNLKTAVQVGLMYLFISKVGFDKNTQYDRYLKKETLQKLLLDIRKINNPFQKLSTDLYAHLISSALSQLEKKGESNLCIDLLFSEDYFHFLCAITYVKG